MIRLTKQTDYGIVLLTNMAKDPGRVMHNARDLGAEAGIPLPMTSKILKRLARVGLLVSHRGVKGGYSLARDPDAITVAQIIDALEGPIAITECTEAASDCQVEACCPVRSNWHKINEAVLHALEGITLAEMAQPFRPALVRLESLLTQRH
jgi:FeS assembly SUF system regulator